MSEKYKTIVKQNEINIHPSMSFSLALLQIFGFFPLHGISDPDHKSLKFSWLSSKTYYSFFHLFLLFLLLSVIVYKMFFIDVTIEEISDLMFYTFGVFSNILFLKLARDWPFLMTEWHNMEVTMGTIGITTNLKKKLKALTLTFLVIAIVEHVLVQCAILIKVLESWKTTDDGFKSYYMRTYFRLVDVIDYALWKGLLVQAISIKTTFAWTYVDVFLILISTAFVLRIKQLTSKVEILFHAKVKNPKLWRAMREEYSRLHKLCSLLDNKLSYIVLLSFCTNLYFILIQLFGLMRFISTTVRKVYYFISFGFLILRLLCVCLSGAAINDQSKKILPLLLSVPSSSYNLEIERFTDQVIKTQFFISGKNFFKITKELVLQIAGAIVAYELVLIQFNSRLLHHVDEIEDNLVVFNSTN